MFCLPYHSICPPETLINKISPQTPSICHGHYMHAHTLTSFFQLLILSLSLSFLQLLSTLLLLLLLLLLPLHSQDSITKPSSLSPSKITFFDLWRQDLNTTTSIFSRTQELSSSPLETANTTT